MNVLEERIKTGLAAEAEAWPDPPAPGTTHHSSITKGLRVALVAAAAVFVVIGVVAVASRTSSSDILVTDELIDSPSTSVPTASDRASPVVDVAEAIAEHPVTLSDGTEVFISFPVADGSDLGVLWAAGLKRGAYEKSYAAVPFSALVHVWLNRSADDVEQEILEVKTAAEQALEEADAASPSALLMDNRYIVDHNGHAYDFQFSGLGDRDLPPEILDQWLTDIDVQQRPDSVFPIVTISEEYEVDYGPQHSVAGIDTEGQQIIVGITEGCEVEPGAPFEQTSDTRSLIKSCVLDGRVELLILGSPTFVDRIRNIDVVRLAASP